MKLITKLYLFLLFSYLFVIHNCDAIDCGEDNCSTDGFSCYDKDPSNNQFCDIKCRPKYGSNKCFYCGFEDEYYTINVDTSPEPNTYTCVSCATGSKILSSKECISASVDTSTLFSLGDIYYKACPIYSRIESGHTCICENRYYIIEINGKNLYNCLSPVSACPPGINFYNFGSKKCYSGPECDTENYIKKYETNGNVRCHSSCVGEEFYKMLSGTVPDSCIDSCERYTSVESNKKYCRDACPNNYKKKNNKCISQEECDFYDSSIDYCLNSCEESGGNLKHNFGSKECIGNCGTNYERDNTCYEISNCNFIQEVGGIKKCLLTCNVGDGFIAPDTGTSKKCYNSCSDYNSGSHKFFNHGENICMEGKCSIVGNNKIYRKVDGFECFSSCKDIGDGTFIYEIKDSSGDYICHSFDSFESTYLNQNVNNYYITKGDGVKKSATSSECFEINYNYLKGRECIPECNYFKGIDNSISPLKNCFEDLNECFSNEYKLYNSNEKNCWKTLPTGYCKISNSGSSGEFEVVPIGVNNNYYDNDGICVTSCKDIGKYIDFDNKKKCISECKIGDEIYFYEPVNNQCIRTCDLGQGFKVINSGPVTKICYSSCPNELTKKYHDYNDNTCLQSCSSTGIRCHKDGDTVCYPSCKDIPEGPNGKYLFQVDDETDNNIKICFDVNPPNCLFYITDSNGVKVCSTSGTCSKRFKKGEECLDDCDGYKANYVETNNGNICLSSLIECFSKGYKYYNTNSKKCWESMPTDSYIKSVNDGKKEVVEDCGNDLFKYVESGQENKCISFEDCLSLGEKIIKGDACLPKNDCAAFIYNSKCISSCQISTDHKYYNHNTKICITGCSLPYLYHQENGYECYRSCNEITPAETYNNLRGNICSEIPCSYYHTIDNTNNIKKCYDSQEECIDAGYEYLKENNDVINECIFEAECEGFKVEEVRNKNRKIVTLGKCFPSVERCRANGYYFYNSEAKECWKDSCKEPFKAMQLDNDGHPEEYEVGDKKETCVYSCPQDYSFLGNYCKKKCSLNTNLYSSEDNEFECYTECPHEKFIDEDNKKCLSKCPENKYHIKDSNECIDLFGCTSKFGDFDSRECVSKCNTRYIRKMTKPESGEIFTICLNKCQDGTYISPDNECISSCTDDTSLNYKIDNTGKKCICKNLYYYDEQNNKIVCLPENVINCYDSINNSGYKIKMYKTSQCVKQCEYIPSLNGEICYKNEEDACKEDLYSSKYNGEKCVCLYKFYQVGDKKICLEESAECPSDYSLYVPETMECVNTCSGDFTKKFRTFCLRACPYGSSDEGSTSECKCKDEAENDKNLWYSAGRNSFVCLGKDDLCPDKYPLLAPQTSECLKQCKGTFYPYYYENKCYSGCSAIPNTVGKSFTNGLASFTCICERPWYYDSSNNNVMHCPGTSESAIHYCEQYVGKNLKFMIHDTKQCVEKCPSDYLYFFNRECFKNCEDANLEYNYSSKKNSYECQCKYLWYIENKAAGIDHKKCLDINVKECISIENVVKPYLIYDTNECVEIGKCSGMYIFNMTCYSKCPENTKEIEEDGTTHYTCSCNQEIDAYWYQYEKLEKAYFVCGVKECPINNRNDDHNRPYLLKEEKQCLSSCPTVSNSWSLRYICINECPDYTKKIESLKKCEFYDLNEEPIVDLETLKYYGNVQAKELYEKSGSLGGYLFNKFEDVSFHVYAIDKSDTLKEYATQSNLTYIDFDTCLPKIFSTYNFRDDDKLLVVKYDLSNWNKQTTIRILDPEPAQDQTPTPENQNKGDGKYLINKVEYEFYNSRTMKPIDASVCDPYELFISYPIIYNKNRFNDYDSGFNYNEYKKKFEMGKLLNLKNNEIDTFNLNDSIYKNLCTGIELYGKDIVFEDRYETLYPNGALLCESNCTYNNTDFAEERVNCKCAYKQGIDFNRKEEEKNDLVNDPNFHLPEQSSSNIEVMKCLSKLKAKDAIVNNEAFYYCTAVTVLVGSMTCITAFYGIKSTSASIANISPQPQSNANGLESQKKFDNNEIKSSRRNLNNPPKKDGTNINYEDDDDEGDHGNIIEHKNIGMNYNVNKDTNDILAESEELNGNKIDYSQKAEYLPQQYNFKYFKLNDKGVIKQIERSKLPFKVSQDTKYLLERKKGVEYHESYLNGPFYQSQNIIEIIDGDSNNNNNNNKNNIYNKKKNNIEVVYKSNQDLIENNKDNSNYNMKQRNVKNNLNLNLNMKSQNHNMKSSEKGEKDFITIKRLKFNKKGLDDTSDNKDGDDYGKKEDDLSLYTLIKREQAFLRISYGKYISKEHNNILAIFLAEILDKVYLVKTCLFLKKFEIFAVYFSLYLFCHLLLLTLSCAFFTTKVIKKIWKEENYPGIQYYLLYGLITNIVVWAVYKVFLCLLDIQDKVKEYLKLKKISNNKDIENDDNLEINEENANNKFNEIIKTLKCRIIIFYCVIFVLIILFALYLISFFSIYTGTKSRVLLAYIYGIVEILLIKFIYGVCLASIRVASEGNELECLYKVVYILDKYIS